MEPLNEAPPTLRDRIAGALDRGYRAAGWDPESESNPDPDHLIDAILAEVRAGADDTPAPEGTVPTPGQLLAKVLDSSVDERLRFAQWALDAGERSSNCFLMDHEGAVEYQTEMRQLSSRLGLSEASIRMAAAGVSGPAGQSLPTDARPVQRAVAAFYDGAPDAQLLAFNPIIGYAMARAIRAAARVARPAGVELRPHERTERIAEGPGQFPDVDPDGRGTGEYSGRAGG